MEDVSLLRLYGYTDALELARVKSNLLMFDVARVVSEHKERYIIITKNGFCEAEITGNLRFTANSRGDFPAVGDWVAVTLYDDDKALIQAIFPRYSVLKREAVGEVANEQILAANVDYGWLIQSVDRDFNLNRLERYLSICYEAGVFPIIVLTKVDLLHSSLRVDIVNQITQRIKGVSVYEISNVTKDGIQKLISSSEKSKTYALLGSSGVGKSTLINNLLGYQQFATKKLSASTHKGRHTTTHREMVLLDNGSVLIDNPGMREIGVADAQSGIHTTFASILRLAEGCKFVDCTHTSEVGCKVIEAINNGDVSQDAYVNYLKMIREQTYFDASVAERRKRDRDFGKFLKQYKNKYGKNH